MAISIERQKILHYFERIIVINIEKPAMPAIQKQLHTFTSSKTTYIIALLNGLKMHNLVNK